MAYNKLPAIEFFRFFFIIWICLVHIWTPFPTHKEVAVAVEFYLMISGFFLYQTYSKKQRTVIEFCAHRFKRLFPVYFIGVTLSYMVYLVDMLKDHLIWDSSLLDHYITESSMLQETGWFIQPIVNSPSWSVSVIFVGSILLYSALRYDEKLLTHLLLPLFILGYYTLIFSEGKMPGDFWGADSDQVKWFVSMPLGRGIAGMGIGVMLGRFMDSYNLEGKRALFVTNLLSVFVIVYLMVHILFIKNEFNGGLLILMVTGLVLASINRLSWLNRLFHSKIWGKLGGLSYGMLMLHIPCRYIINFGYSLYPVSRISWMVLYILLVVLFAWAVQIALHKIMPNH